MMRLADAAIAAILCSLIPSVARSQDQDTVRATVNTISLPVTSETSQAGAVLRVLQKGDVVTIGFSIGTETGEWCNVSPWYVPCRAVERQTPPPPAPVAPKETPPKKEPQP